MSRKLIVLLTVLSAIVLLGTTLAQQNRRAIPAERAAGKNRPTTKAKPKLMIESFLKQTDVAAKPLTQMRKMPLFKRALEIKGSTIRPKAGFQLIRLTDGSFVITNGKPDISVQMDTWWDFELTPNGVKYYFAMCGCNLRESGVINSEDGCFYENKTSGRSPGLCTGPQCCGEIKGVIDENGNVTWD